MVERVAHQGLEDLDYRAADKPVVGRLAAADRLVAAVGKPAAAHKHAGELRPLLVGDERFPLADDGRPLLVGDERFPLADDGRLPLAGVEPLQRGQVVVGFVLRFSDRNRGRTCSQY